MAWQVPLSQTGPGIIVNLGETDSAFIASGVTVWSNNFQPSPASAAIIT